MARELFGRERELAWLDDTWDRRRANVATIVAPGGVGKTALAHAFRDRLLARDRDVERVFDWTFHGPSMREYSACAADAFLRAALRAFGAHEVARSSASAWNKARQLSQLVAERRALLLLDGLDRLQHPDLEPAIAKLLADLAGRNAGLCLVTTREVVRELEGFGRSSSPCWQLEGLSGEGGAELLRGVLEREGAAAPLRSEASERVEISQATRGHPLTLQLLGGHLRQLGELRRWRDLVLAGTQPRGHVASVLDAIARHVAGPPDEARPGWLSRLFGSTPARTWTLGQQQLAALELLSLFDRPADPYCIAALTRAPAIAGLTDPLVDIDAAAWRVLASSLEEMGLVSRGLHEVVPVCGYDKSTAEQAGARGPVPGNPRPWPSPAPDPDAATLDLHPVVREHLAARVRQNEEPAWREGHRRLYEHLCKSTPHWPEELEGLLPLFRAVAHGCAAGRVQEACDAVYHARILRGSRVYSHAIGAYGADLWAVGCFFEHAWDRPSTELTQTDRAWMLGQASSNLRHLGRLHEAAEPMRAGLELRVATEHWHNAAIVAANLSELELMLGNTSASVEAAARSLEYADRGEDGFMRMSRRATLAHARHQAGEEERARELYEEAEVLQGQRQPDHRLLYSQRGREYAELLLAPSERAAWRAVLGAAIDDAVQLIDDAVQPLTRCAEVFARASWTLAVSRRQGWLTDAALDHLTLGQACLYAAVLHVVAPAAALAPELTHASAREHIDAALDGLRKTGNVEFIAQALMARAFLRHHDTHLALAHADLDEAWTLVERGPMPLFQADIQLARARLFRDRPALDHARELIVRHGYGRRLVELEDAERAAQSWPERVTS